jgi:hypothetical protein
MIDWPSFLAGVATMLLFSVAFAIIAVNFFEPSIVSGEVSLDDLPQIPLRFLLDIPSVVALIRNGRGRLLVIVRELVDQDVSAILWIRQQLGVELVLRTHRGGSLDAIGGTVIWRRS